MVKKHIKKPVFKKKVVVPIPRVTDLDKKNSSKIKGYYIQIAALTKKPTKRFLANIMKKGYDYKLYNIKIKGKQYTKVLIGPYSSKKVALSKRLKLEKHLKIQVLI